MIQYSNGESNESLIRRFAPSISRDVGFYPRPEYMAIETMQWRGQPMFWQSIATLIWIGRFKQVWVDRDPELLRYSEIVRETVKLYVCGATARKDSHVRAALEELYGGKAAKGDAEFPGPLYGIAKHGWQALALGVAWLAQWYGESDSEGRRT